MGKSVYSLVLNDEIIDMIDNVAYKKGVSRSTLVNSVLAEYVGYRTPQKILGDMFDMIDQIINGESRMRLLGRDSNSGFSIVSALNYKYSPRITYAIELSEKSNILGELVITYRTSKQELIGLIEEFFGKWIELEKHYLSFNPQYHLSDGKLKRELYLVDKNASAEDIAKMLTDYVRNLDKMLNLYISDNPMTRDSLCEMRFLNLDTRGKI